MGYSKCRWSVGLGRTLPSGETKLGTFLSLDYNWSKNGVRQRNKEDKFDEKFLPETNKKDEFDEIFLPDKGGTDRLEDR